MRKVLVLAVLFAASPVLAEEVPPGARLDPVVAGKVQSAAVKYGWSGGLKVTSIIGAVVAGGLFIAARNAESDGYVTLSRTLDGYFWGNLAFAAVGAGVAYLIDQSAADDMLAAGYREPPPPPVAPTPMKPPSAPSQDRPQRPDLSR